MMDYKAFRKYVIYVIVGAATIGVVGHEVADVAAEHFNFPAIAEYTLEGILTLVGVIGGAKLGSRVYDAVDFYDNRNRKKKE